MFHEQLKEVRWKSEKRKRNIHHVIYRDEKRRACARLFRYDNCVMIKCADTERVPPASGVIVKAAAVPAGLRTVRTEFVVVVSTSAMPTICEAPVARPTTV